MSRPDELVGALRAHLSEDVATREALVRSLALARQRAQSALRAPLYEALEWPTDVASYAAFVERALRYVPRQTPGAAWQGEDGGAQEMKERMAHFFWLIDQPLDDASQGPHGGHTLQFWPWMRQWVTDVWAAWGSFLDSPDSLTPQTLASFIDHSPQYNVQDSMIQGRPNCPSGWRSFNQFFARQLNAGLRPIGHPCDNRVLSAVADAKRVAEYPITQDGSFEGIRIKDTHAYATVEGLLGRASPEFHGGVMCHYMLSAHSYHRFHAALSGRVVQSQILRQRAVLRVELDAETGGYDPQDDFSQGYPWMQTRGVLCLDTSDHPQADVGAVATIAVGMGQVSSVVQHASPGATLAKGEEYGYFQFGGSDVIVMVGPGWTFLHEDGAQLKVGHPIAHHESFQEG